MSGEQGPLAEGQGDASQRELDPRQIAGARRGAEAIEEWNFIEREGQVGGKSRHASPLRGGDGLQSVGRVCLAAAPAAGRRRRNAARRHASLRVHPVSAPKAPTSMARPDAESLFTPGATVSRGVALASAHAGAATVRLGGESVELLAERAIHWPGGRTLFVADVHLGKAASFRAEGVPIPRGATATDLARLDGLIARTSAQRLVVLGDFLHAAAGRVPALDTAFMEWRGMHAALSITLVRGNHDDRAGDPPPAWGIEVVPDPHVLAPFVLCHEPATPRTGHALCGHVHPGVRIARGAHESVRVPCFVLGRRHTLLPAFGRLTGLALVAPEPGETVVAIAGTRLFALPSRP